MMKMNHFLITIALSLIAIPAYTDTKVTNIVPGQQNQPPSSTVAAEDASIIKDLQIRLSQNQKLIGTKITVTSDGGVVSLTGDVDTQAQADAAILDAKSVPGVKDVKSNIRVKKGVTVDTISGPAVKIQ